MATDQSSPSVIHHKPNISRLNVTDSPLSKPKLLTPVQFGGIGLRDIASYLVNQINQHQNNHFRANTSLPNRIDSSQFNTTTTTTDSSPKESLTENEFVAVTLSQSTTPVPFETTKASLPSSTIKSNTLPDIDGFFISSETSSKTPNELLDWTTTARPPTRTSTVAYNRVLVTSEESFSLYSIKQGTTTEDSVDYMDEMISIPVNHSRPNDLPLNEFSPGLYPVNEFSLPANFSEGSTSSNRTSKKLIKLPNYDANPNNSVSVGGHQEDEDDLYNKYLVDTKVGNESMHDFMDIDGLFDRRGTPVLTIV